MLCLTRKEGEKIVIGNNVVLTLLRIQGDRISVGIDAASGAAASPTPAYTAKNSPKRGVKSEDVARERFTETGFQDRLG